jgi:hypothetical protein
MNHIDDAADGSITRVTLAKNLVTKTAESRRRQPLTGASYTEESGSMKLISQDLELLFNKKCHY